MPALLISGTNMRAGRGDSREDCSALFSVFTAEQEMRATCSMPCKQLLPGECTSSAANRQVNAIRRAVEQFLVRGAGASQRIAGQAIVQGFANVMLAAAILCGLALVAVCCMRTSADKDAALQHDTVDQQRAFSARID